MAQYFITGIGTGVGKTLVTASLLHQAPHYRAVKPVLSGYEEDSADESDAAVLQRAMPTDVTLSAISPWRFTAPLSPHLAAEKEGKAIEPEELLSWCREQIAVHPDLLIEGVGGLMVPVTPTWLVRDWIQALGLPVILVSASYLGAINHTLLTLRALSEAAIDVQAIIVSESAQDDAGLQDTVDSIAPFAKGIPIAAVPRIHTQTPWKDAPDLLSLVV